MKKNKEWLQGKVSEAEEKTTKKAMCEYTLGYDQALIDVDKLIDQLDEPAKVVIPQFVADWITSQKQKSINIYGSIASIAVCGDINGWCIKVDGSNSYETLCKAWFNGYEIEKEKKYYVLNKDGESILRKQLNGEISTSMGIDIKTSSTPKNYQFTIEEIKKYDERFMPFVVEVDDE